MKAIALGISLGLLLTAIGCGGGTTTTSPTPATEGFLAGRWTGTMTISQAGSPDSVAATEWVLQQVQNASGATYTGTAVIRDTWLPVTVAITAVVLPPQPGGTVTTSGFYPSPRGCSGTFWSDGAASKTELNGTIGGVDCVNAVPGTFRGLGAANEGAMTRRRSIVTVIRYGLSGVLGALLTTSTIWAQGIPVVDVAGLAKIIEIVKAIQTAQSIEKEMQVTVQRMSQGFGGNMNVYRVPAIPTANHDVGRYTYAGPLLEGLNTGDPRGDRYNQVVRKVDKPGTLYTNLSPDAQRQMEAHYATLEIYDSTATLGVHQAAMSRVYGEQIAELIAKLEGDITNPGSEYHQATAIADNLSVAALIAARQNQSANQMDSSILEQLLARNKARRDAAVVSNNMAITALKDKGAMSKTVVGSATQTLRDWRLP